MGDCQAAAAGISRCFQCQGSSSFSCEAGWSAMRRRTSASQACGSTPLSFAVAIKVYIAAARSAARSEPANNHARRPRAMRRKARSAALLDRQMRPSSRKRIKAGQRLSTAKPSRLRIFVLYQREGANRCPLTSPTFAPFRPGNPPIWRRFFRALCYVEPHRNRLISRNKARARGWHPSATDRNRRQFSGFPGRDGAKVGLVKGQRFAPSL